MAPLEITISKPSPPAPLPKPDPRKSGGRKADIAILEINGQLFQDWETIAVRLTEEEPPFYTFRFTCSEGMPLVKNFAALRIRPGDACQVVLSGEPVVYGYVSTRQVFYDAQRHHIEIQGNSHVAGLQYTSVIHKTMEFKKVTFEQYARTLLKPFAPKINFVVNGQLPQTKFPRIAIPHGMSVMEALEIPLRTLGGVSFTSNPKGDLVANAGPATGGSDTVVEGKNILEGREIIYSQGMANNSIHLGQNWGTDKEHGPKIASKPFASKAINGSVDLSGQYRPQVAPLDMPAYDDSHLKGRAQMEHDTMLNDEVTVFATVQGWQRPSGGLWKPRQLIRVISPMLIMDGSDELKAKSVTFTQDNERGTRTILELCNNVAMHGSGRSTAGGENEEGGGTGGLPGGASEETAAGTIPPGG